MTFQAKQTRPQSRAIPPFPASAVGQRFQFEDGQRGEVVALVNGGALAMFASDTGARFTVRSDELSPIGSPLPPPRPSTVGIFRTIARFESSGKPQQKTPSQQPQAAATPRRIPPLRFGQGADAINVYQQRDAESFGYTFDRGGHKYGDIGFRTIDDALRAARRARNLAPSASPEPDRDDQTDLPSDGQASPYDSDPVQQ